MSDIRDKVLKAVSLLKSNKSQEDHQIHREMLKFGGETPLRLLHSLCNDILKTGLIPEEWKYN